MAIALALGASILFGVGTALQSSVAKAGGSTLQWGLVRRLATNRRWLTGTVCVDVGVFAHIAALRFGPLALVQPLALAGLLFALPLEALMGERRLSAAQLVAAAEVVAGLAVIVVADHASRSRPEAPPWLTMVVVAPIVTACACVGIYLRDGGVHDPRWRALTLGITAGTCLGVSSVFVRQTLLEVDATGATALWSPSAATFAITGLMGVLLSQAALASGRLSWSLPAQDLTALLSSITLGAVLLGEMPHFGAGVAAVDALALIALGHGLGTLAQRAVDPDSHT
nr:DMT family transporter [Actinopolymorpha rutila]